MSGFIHKLAWRAYHFVHSNEWLADLAYAWGFHGQRLLRHWRYRSVASNTVTVEELLTQREFGLASGLLTSVTNICNAKCSFCIYPKAVASKTLETGIMPLAIFQKAVDEWAKAGGVQINLTPVVGDPLVDPGLLDKLDYAVKKGMRVILTTNAILLDKNDNYRQLIDRGLREIYISIHGTTKARYEEIYGVDHFDEAMSGIRHLLEYNRRQGEPTKIGIRFRNAEKPSEIIRSMEFKKFLKPYFSEKVRVNYSVDFDNWGGAIKVEDLRGRMRFRELPQQLNIPCVYLFRVMVLHEGSVRMCGCRFVRSEKDDLVIGNMREKSLKELVESDKGWGIIKDFYRGERRETCRGCTFYEPIDRNWLATRMQARKRIAARSTSD